MIFASVVLASAMTNFSGVVTFEREGLPFYFLKDDAGVNWRVKKVDGVTPHVGDMVEVTGEKEFSSKPRLLTSGIVVKGKSAGAAPAPAEVTIEELFNAVMPHGNPAWYGGMFVAEGLLRDINRRQNSTQLLVGDGERNIQVDMPCALDQALPVDFVVGSTVRVTGALAYTSIEDLENGSFARIENLELIPMTLGDVQIVDRAPPPPFWTARKLRIVFGAAGVVFLLMFAWVVTLRKMLRRKIRELAELIRARETTRIEADAARRERLRLAADLHDGFQQYLAGAMFRLKAARNYLPREAVKSAEQLEKVQDALQHTQNGLRSTIWAMNEESEGPESLMGLFAFVARRMPHWDGVVEIKSEGEERNVARNYCGSLLLIVQEAVGNAIRHGKATKVEVKIHFKDNEIVLSVIDNGTGFDVGSKDSLSGHYGLRTMERRINELGGSMRIESSRDGGTRIFFIGRF